MERLFIDPATGDIHPESYYHAENIDLATVIEAVDEEGGLGFIIIPENVGRMRVRSDVVFEIFKTFMLSLTAAMEQADDDEECERLRQTGHLVSINMLKNLAEMQMEGNRADLH